MNLTPLGPNMTQLKLSGGLTLLFSYKTPVACVWGDDKSFPFAYKTGKKWSNTTTRHINSWLKTWPLAILETRPQEYFDSLAARC